MADPLSITASIAGLLATAVAVYQALSDATASVVDAPVSARRLLATVNEMSLTLATIHELFEKISTLPTERRALIRLDHITATFTQCVLTLSELEALVCGKLIREGGLRSRFLWALNEKKVTRLLPQLESQKSCLTLMIGVLQCKSWMEALDDRDRLTDALETMLQKNESLVARMEKLEIDIEPDTRSIRFSEDESPVQSPERSTLDEMLVPAPVVNNAGLSLPEGREFEITLKSSKVYTRAEPNENDMLSVRGSTLRSGGTSLLSRLSMNHMSIIAVYRLPITLADINGMGTDLTFARLLRGDDKTREAKYNIKLLVVGDFSDSLKSKLRYTFVNGRYPSVWVPNSDGQYSVEVDLNGELVMIHVWDTNGMEEYDRIRHSSYPEANVALMCTQIGDEETFDNIQNRWISEIAYSCPGIPILLAGIRVPKEGETSIRKDDSHRERKANYELGSRVANRIKAQKYMDCDLWDIGSVNRIFREAAIAGLNSKYPPSSAINKKIQRLKGKEAKVLTGHTPITYLNEIQANRGMGTLRL